MSDRKPVHSPYDLRGGDRVELLDHDNRARFALIDLLWRDGLIWVGVVVFASPGSRCMDGEPMKAGAIGGIGAGAYLENEVFLRRRAREDQQQYICREVTRG